LIFIHLYLIWFRLKYQFQTNEILFTPKVIVFPILLASRAQIV
jgi:hypothetical protein